MINSLQQLIVLDPALKAIYAISCGALFIYSLKENRNLTAWLIKLYFLLASFYGLFQQSSQVFGIRLAYDIIIVIMLLLVIFKAMRRERLNIPKGNKFFIAFTILFIFTGFLNRNGLFDSILNYRYYLYGYVIYLVVINSSMNVDDLKKVNRFLSIVFLLQIFFSLFKVLIMGPMEPIVGSLIVYGGVISTLFPLVCISMLFARYLVYDKDKWTILLIIGFMFMAWAGNKRAFWFYLPLLLIFGYYYYLKLERKASTIFGRTLKVSPILLLIPVIIFIGAVYNPTLNPEKIIGGTFDYDYLSTYIRDYYLSENEFGPSQRLSGTISVVVRFLNDPITRQLIGNGSTFIEDFRKRSTITKYRGYWGRETGFNYIIVSFGILGLIFILSYYFNQSKMVYSIYRHSNDNYLKMICLGALITIILFYIDTLTYSRSMLINHLLGPFLFYIIGSCYKYSMIISPQKRL